MKKMIYAVKNGKQRGIFNEWLKCSEQTNKYPNSKFRRFEYRSELEDEAEDVPGSLRYAIKEAKEYLGDLVYLGKCDDCLEDAGWKEDGCLPFGDAPMVEIPSPFANEKEREEYEEYLHLSGFELEAEEPEFFPDEEEQEAEEWETEEQQEEEEFEADDEEYEKALADSRGASDVQTGYWTMAEDMLQYINVIKTERKGSRKAETAAGKLKKLLERCLSDVNLNRLTAVYRDMQEENAIGYNADAVNTFMRQMRAAYPKPKLSDIEEMEEKVSLRQLLMETGALESELRERVVGQDVAIERLRSAYFDREMENQMKPNRRGPRGVYLLAGPPGVGKTFMAQHFAVKLGFPFKRFDMSGYSNHESIQELVGFAPTWKDSEPGILTEFMTMNPRCVLLFDEIEKAEMAVIRLFLQILDDGICEDKYNKRNVSFKNAIIFFTTNAGRQLYDEAQNENLSLLSDQVVVDALKKDEDSEKKRPYFPPEILSRMSSYTVIMLNRLKADAIYRLVEKEIKERLFRMKKEYGYELKWGEEYLARTVLYSMGGSADARNASKAAGKLIGKEFYELLKLIEEKKGLDEDSTIRRIEWKCDFKGVTEEIRDFYFGERDCVILIFGTVKYEPTNKIKNNNVRVRSTVDVKEFMEIVYKENVLFAVVDYIQGLENLKNVADGMSVLDAGTVGREAFRKLRKEAKELPVYILDGSHGYDYLEKEKIDLIKKGAAGFVVGEGRCFGKQLEQTYMDVCCQEAMKTMAARHQRLTYDTRKEFDEIFNVGSIVFCNFKFETAVESEDKSSMLSDDLRPDKSWDELYVSRNLKDELTFFIEYLKNPKKYRKTGINPRGILLYGFPGTGKTSLAKVVASESGVNFLSISASELLNGGIEKVKDEFRVARKYAPAILFIDEIDAIAVKREYSVGPNPVLNELLVQMDGFNKVDGKPVFVMAATNHEEKIDFALLRRFDRSFRMDYLDRAGRKWQLERLIRKQGDMFAVSAEKLESIVDRSEHVSPAILEQVVEAALREGIRSDRIIDDDLFDEIFEKRILGEERVDTSQENLERIAYHEAGHALIELYYGRPPAYMSVVARGDYGGYTLGTKRGDSTKGYYLERICATLGGRAAEMVFEYSLTSGASSDLQSATDIATAMVCEYGMYEKEVGLGVIKELEKSSNEKARELVNRILSEQLKEATGIIEANRDAMKRLAETVMKNGKKYLTRNEILETAGRLNKK